MDIINATKEANSQELKQQVRDIAKTYAGEISKLAQAENIQILVNRKIVSDIYEYVFYSPVNIGHSRVDEHVGLPRGTISKIIGDDKSECCRTFSKYYFAMKSKKDFGINQGITIEATLDPKFGLEYQRLTQPMDFGKQYIEKTEHKTLTMEIKNLPDEELDNRIKQLETKLSLVDDKTIGLKQNDDGSYEYEADEQD